LISKDLDAVIGNNNFKLLITSFAEDGEDGELKFDLSFQQMKKY
jgi:hypothetical protein